MADEAEANQSPTPDDAPPMAPHLDDCVISEILYRLPTKEAYRLTAVCRRWRAIVSEPAFLCRHLSPRPLPLLDDGPFAVILQPRRKVGYTHLTVVPTNPDDDSVDLNLPLDPKYTDIPSVKPQVRKWSERSSKRHEPPAPSLVDVDGEEFFTNLFSTGVGDLDADMEEPGQLPDESEPGPAVEVELEDHVAFLERTVPKLDISIVASHGRLLLGRSRSRYYVCDPAANRWIVLPPSSVLPTRDAARGLHYDLDAATGRVAFTVVLLMRIPERRVHVETFSSTTGRWDTKVIGAQGVARCLGVASPGMHAGTCFYWLSQRRGRVVCYDVAGGRASVLREPPEAAGSNGRVGRSLGTASGRLRLCAFDIRDEKSGNMMPHEDIEGEHSVWVMDVDPAAGAWRRVHQAVVDDISVWYFLSLWNHEVPVDYADACGGSIIVNKNRDLLRYDLESGHKVELARLHTNGSKLGALYRRFHAFPFFRSD